MKDSVIKGTGNSRYLKSSLEGNTTWEQFRAALAAGTLPVDLNGINPEGFQQLGDPLNKATFLKDATAAKFGKDINAVPDALLDVLSAGVLQNPLPGGDNIVWSALDNFPQVTNPMLVGTNGLLVVAPYNQTTTVGYASNDAGKTWEQINLPFAQIMFLSAVNGYFIAEKNGVYAVSTDGGKTWSQHTSHSNADVYACWGGTRFVFVSSDGYSYYTSDFATVSLGGNLQQGCYVTCCGDNGRIVTLGQSSNALTKAAYSDDEGDTWVTVTRPSAQPRGGPGSIAYLPGVGFIAIPVSGTQVLISPDGKSWSLSTISGAKFTQDSSDICLLVVDGTLFAGTARDGIAWTTDGINWGQTNNVAKWLVDAGSALLASNGTIGKPKALLTDVLGNMVNIPLKQIAGAASIEIGTYTGTGATTLTLKTNGKPQIMFLFEEKLGSSSYPHCLIALLPDDLNNNVLYLPAIRFKGNNGATLEGAPVELTALSNDTLKIETSGLQNAQDIFNRSGTLYRFYFLFKEG